MYNSGGEPVIYEQISMRQFVTGYLSVLDTVKSGGKQVMLKHLNELVANAFTYMDVGLYEPTMECGSSSSKMGGLSGMMLISSWSLDVSWS